MKKTVFVLIVAMMTYSSCEEVNPQQTIVTSKADSAKKAAYEYFKKGDYFQSLDYYYKALDQYRIIGDDLQISKVTSNIGNVYSKAGFHSMALSFYHDAFEQRKLLKDTEGIAKLYYNIGRAYEYNKQSQEAREFLNLADSAFSELSQENYKVRILNELGRTYRLDSSYVEARNYYNTALSIEDDKSMTGLLLKNIGYSYHLEGNDDQALTYYHKALKLQDDLQPDVRTRLFQNLANIHQDQDSVAWYYAQGFNKDLIWIDDLYFYTTNTLARYLHENTNYDSSQYYYELEHQAGLRSNKQRDELKRLYDQYQVKYAHHKEQTRQQAALLEKEQARKLLINSVISGVLLLTIIFIGYKYRTATGRASIIFENN